MAGTTDARANVLRRIASLLGRTPFHPQWLMPEVAVAAGVRLCRGRVLDVGSATGWVAGHLAADAQYIALDYPMTATALYGTRPHLFADACCLPIGSGTIDAVTCYEVMEHVQRPEALLSEVARVLAPGGVAEFTMPFFYPIHDAPHDYQRWTSYGWKRSLRQAGLKIEVLEARGHPLHAVAVTACLGLAAPLMKSGPAALVLGVPLLLLVLPVINITSWVQTPPRPGSWTSSATIRSSRAWPPTRG